MSSEELDIELVEAYPAPKNKHNENLYEKNKEIGSCHVLVKNFGMEIKNIPYYISKTSGVKVVMPGSVHKGEGNSKLKVNTINFTDWKKQKSFLKKIAAQIREEEEKEKK